MHIERLHVLEKQISKLEGPALEIKPENSPYYPEIMKMLQKGRTHRKKLIAK